MVSATKIDLSSLEPNPNTSGSRTHEEKRMGPAGIGISEDSHGSVNDRIILKWQTFAGRYAEKTIDRHLEAIRFFENTTDKKPFARLTATDVEKCRVALKTALAANGERALSRSTVQHGASHEAEHEGPVDTVIKAVNFGTPNGRILYKWQSFAGKYSGKTMDRHLFPENRSLSELPDRNSGTRLPIPVMRSTHSVRQAFKNACAGHLTAYSPHSAKHTIAAERDNRQLIREERKAWSENMGHESERITEAHYGKLSDERRFEVLENIADGPTRGPHAELSDKVKTARLSRKSSSVWAMSVLPAFQQDRGFVATQFRMCPT